MAIPTTYATLQTTLVDWIKRDDQTDRLTLYIAMAESAMNARLRLRVMESTEALTLTAGLGYVALPSRFIEPVSLVYTSSSEVLTQVDRETLDAEYGKTGQPSYYAYGAGQIDFDSTADSNYALTLRYTKALDLATDTTNDVLTMAPFAYLYGAMQAYCRWAEDGENLAQYTAMFQQELRQLEERDRASRGSVMLRTELPAAVGDSYFNITTG